MHKLNSEYNPNVGNILNFTSISRKPVYSEYKSWSWKAWFRQGSMYLCRLVRYSDIYVDLSNKYVDLSGLNLSLWHKKQLTNRHKYLRRRHNYLTDRHIYLTRRHNYLTCRHNYLTRRHNYLTFRYNYLIIRRQKYSSLQRVSKTKFRLTINVWLD